MIAECINKLATASQITHRIADEALDFFQRSQRNYAAPVIAESPPLLSSMLFLRSCGEGL